MSLSDNINRREFDKFTENSSGETAIRTVTELSSSTSGSEVLSSTPKIYNVEVTIAGTEFSQVLSENTNSFLIRVRGKAKLQFSFVSGETNSNFITIPSGASFSMNKLKLNSTTIYFESDRPNQVVEILEWT